MANTVIALSDMANNSRRLSYLLGLVIAVFTILVSVGMSDSSWALYKEYSITAAAAPTPGVTPGGGGYAAAQPHPSTAFAVTSLTIIGLVYVMPLRLN